MSIQYAYSLCDGMEFYLEARPTIDAQVCRIYLGSYFCDRYYCALPDHVWHECFAAIREHGTAAVLVIPTPSQQRLAETKVRTRMLLEHYGDLIQEVAVNDSAMLAWISEQYPQKAIWLGRTMDKELRDPRYAVPGTHRKLLEQVEAGLCLQANILGVETDVTHPDPEPALNSRYLLGIHTDLAYLTMGRICEFASIGLPPSEKFQLYRPCRRQCMANWIWYEQHDLSFLKHGRAVYTPVSEELSLSQDSNIRIIASILGAKTADQSRKREHE